MSNLIGTDNDDSMPFIRLEPNVVRSTGQPSLTLIFRYVSSNLQMRLLAGTGERVWFFIDDDIWAIDPDARLPTGYRRRLETYRRCMAEPLIARAERVLSPSERILRRFPEIPGSKVPPALVYSLPDLDHHNRLPNGRFDMIFSGTRSHLADLEMIVGPLRKALQANPHWRLTTFLGRHAPDELRLANARHLSPMNWQAYRSFVADHRFHVALCPLRPTAFNAARSTTRLFDNAAFGATVLYTPNPPYDAIFRGELGLPFDVSQLRETLEACARDPVATRRHAFALAEAARSIDGGDFQRSFFVTASNQKNLIGQGRRLPNDQREPKVATR